MLSTPWMLNKYHKQAQYQLSLKMNKEKGGRRRGRNLLPYELACWQPAPVPCPLNDPAQKKVNLVHIRETHFHHLLQESLWTDSLAQTPTPFHPKLHMSVDQEKGNQLQLEDHKEIRLGSSIGSQLLRALPHYVSTLWKSECSLE